MGIRIKEEDILKELIRLLERRENIKSLTEYFYSTSDIYNIAVMYYELTGEDLNIRTKTNNKLANRTTVEERLTTKINELGSTFNEKYEKLNSSIVEIKKEMFSEDDIKKIIESETYTLRRTVEKHDKELFPPEEELGQKDIEYFEKLKREAPFVSVFFERNDNGNYPDTLVSAWTVGAFS